MKTLNLHPHFKEFLFSLLDHKVHFVVVGAYALAVHGRPRYTKDIDILVEPTRANARRLARCFADFGYDAIGNEAEAHFSAPERMATIGVEPVRIDILSSITGVTFPAAWKGRTRLKIEGRMLPFLGMRELERAKRASGRPQDLADVAALAELKKARRP